MFRVASACFAMGLALCAQTGAASAGGGFSGPKGTKVGGGFGTVASFHGRRWHPPVHRFHRRWRPFAPLFLDRRDSAPVVINVNRIAPVTVLPTALAMPSVANLPAVAGIRQPSPSEPSVYVLNDPPGAESSFFPKATARSPGPRIISLGAEEAEWASDEADPVGARIIHLTVPVGSRR